MADDPTMDALRRALLAENAAAPAPSVDRIQKLRSAVERRRAREVALPGEQIRPRRRWPRLLAAAAAMVALFAVGVVVGHDLPGPLRDASNELGLPVDSPDLEATRDRLDELGHALTAATQAHAEGQLGDREFKAIARADAAMLDEVARLDADEKAEIVPVAHQVHLQAVLFFDENGRELPTAKPSDLEEIGRPGTGD
jgi:hypothetical protein